MCSRKWEIPLMFFSSYFEPTPNIIMTVVVVVPFIGTITTRSPFDNRNSFAIKLL